MEESELLLDLAIEEEDANTLSEVAHQVQALEDRIKARIIYTDGRSQETIGRICYCNEDEASGGYAYGFSIITGFIH